MDILAHVLQHSSKLDLENPDGTGNLDFEIKTQDVNERQQRNGNPQTKEQVRKRI